MLNDAALSAETLAAVLDQSIDCVKLISPDGGVRWMNGNGLCAMEIDDFAAVQGRQWADIWPDEARQAIGTSLGAARTGQPARFTSFCPTAKGAPRWWDVTVSPVKGVDGEDAGFLAISRDITEAETSREALEIAAAELRHRLRNTYTMVGSLLSGFARGNPDRETFAEEMVSRLVSLSAAQSLFSTHEAPCKVAVLIQALVKPFEGSGAVIEIGRLPATLVDQGQADAIALVLGELAVNSAKHGALSSAGRLDVDAVEDAGQLRITWSEEGPRPVQLHARAGGQGLALIERIVRARRGTLNIEWRDHGLTVTLSFALTRPAAGNAHES